MLIELNLWTCPFNMKKRNLSNKSQNKFFCISNPVIDPFKSSLNRINHSKSLKFHIYLIPSFFTWALLINLNSPPKHQTRKWQRLCPWALVLIHHCMTVRHTIQCKYTFILRPMRRFFLPQPKMRKCKFLQRQYEFKLYSHLPLKRLL